MANTRFSIVVVAVLLLIAVLPHVAWAAQATATQLEDPNYIPGLWPSVIANINITLNKALANNTYSLWTKGVFAGLMIIGGFWKFFQWNIGNLKTGDAIAYGLQIILLSIALATYTTWTYWMFEAGYELATMIQVATLDTDLLLGPSVYIGKVFGAYTLDNSGNILDFSITRVFVALIFVFVQAILAFAAYISVILPTLIYMLAKLIGPVFFIGLAFEKTAFLFEGWLKLLLFASIYAFIGRLVLIIVALLAGGLTGVTPSISASPQLIVIPATDFSAYITLFCMMAISIFFIAGAGGFTAYIVGGRDIGMGKTIGQAGKAITAMFV